ncbi:MAG: hypothetical protein ABEJ30_07440 [Halorientalis sp.]
MYDRNRIAGGLASAFVVWVVVAMLIMNTGVAMGAYPVSGVGGFVLAGSTIDAQQMLVYPGTADSRGGTTPAAVLEFQNVTIEDFTLAFNLDLNSVPQVDGIVSIRFTSVQNADLVAEGVIVKASAVRADQAVFQNLVYDDMYSTQASQKIEITGTQATLTGSVRIQTHYLAVRQFDFPAFELEVWWDTDRDGVWEYGGP